MIKYLTNAIPFLTLGIEIFVGVFLCTINFQRKEKLLIRILLSVIICIIAVFSFASFSFFSKPEWSSFWECAYYVFASVVTILTVFFCYQEKPIAVIFSAMIALVGRALADAVASTVSLLLIENALIQHDIITYFIRLGCMVICYIFIYFAFVRSYQRDAYVYIKGDGFLFPCIFFVVSVFLYAMRFVLTRFDAVYSIVLYSCVGVYALISLLVARGIFNQGEAKMEVDLVKQLWNEDRKRYETQKETIDIINIKCHDFRHQLQNVRKSGNITEKAIKDVEKSIAIYDSLIKTNNEVLDVILSNFYLRCQNNNILFTCMVDGEKLNFMDEIDIYSLFGNMLENALECEQKVFPKENRFISLIAQQANGVLSIRAENYYKGDAVVKDGTVITTKTDKNYHGFGMKSMQRIVDKYNGQFNVVIDDDMFQVRIVFV